MPCCCRLAPCAARCRRGCTCQKESIYNIIRTYLSFMAAQRSLTQTRIPCTASWFITCNKRVKLELVMSAQAAHEQRHPRNGDELQTATATTCATTKATAATSATATSSSSSRTAHEERSLLRCRLGPPQVTSA
eukprot:6206080-Pleurochrysis_carterae.AAC.1